MKSNLFTFIINNKYKVIGVFIIILIIISITLLIVDRQRKHQDLVGNKNYDTTKNIDVIISKGSYLSSIANVLYNKGIILYKDEFIKYAKNSGNSKKYKYGVFSLNKDMSYELLDKKLQEVVPAPDSIKITIPEGYELRQIISLLEQRGLGKITNYTKTILEDNFNYWFLKGIIKSEVCLEGYLFPATYYFPKKSTEHEVLNIMLKKFNSVFTEEMKAKAKSLNMNINEVITLASIVEREAGNNSERAIVASVFYNRLNSKTYPYLESCATVQYILKERKAILSIADTKIKSPYNTYINPGLPPHPIASPGLDSINATLNPANTEYLFFVLGKDGKHVFSRTYAEHLKAKEEAK